ncbi:uncharacterized protein SCHCODRAFT_01240715 [Schizophyllum commune H4-8]|nr:uncharacterized protein SCHCODRAFT_01240715 [Schizophyllum commune H4-8]KAI5887813.1 hypothetical protein SCHCODRAFT_01240715 [Schizophyllum commune H4-8]
MPHRTNVHFEEEAEVIPPSPSGTRAAEVPPTTPALASTATLAPAHTAASMPGEAARVPTEARYAHNGVAYAPTRSESEPSPSPSNAPGLAASNAPGPTTASHAPHRRPGYAQTPYHRPASIESDGEEVTAATVPPRPLPSARPSAPVRPSSPVLGSSPSPSNGSTSSASYGSTSSPSHGSSSSASYGSSPSPFQDTPRPSRHAPQVSEATPRPTPNSIPSHQQTPRQPYHTHLYNVPPTTSSDQSTSSTSSSSDVRVHGLLAYRPSRALGLTWDFARSFTSNVDRAMAAGIKLDDPATQPATRGADIDIVTPCGTAHVSPRATDYVQVIDVLRSLHAHFCTPVTDAEYQEALKQDPDAEISSTFWKRCDAIRDAAVRQQEVSRGVLHLDSLLGKTRLAGLAKRRAPGEWELKTLPRDSGAAPS